jgi:hypothetical protein
MIKISKQSSEGLLHSQRRRLQVKTAFEPGSDKHLSLYRELAGLPAYWPREES